MSSKIYIGNENIGNLYLGESEIQKIYIGNVEVYSKDSGSWEYPQLDDDVLTITQVFDASQVGSSLYLDRGSYVVNVSATNGVVVGGGTYLEGESCSLSATANEGYQFEKFTINSVDITTNPYTFTPTQDTNVVASFKEITKSYTLTLSGITSYSWSLTSSPANPDSSLYDGVYIPSNKGVNSSYGVMRIDFQGYETFNVYIRSYAEGNYDYTIASGLDATSYPTASDSSGVKAHTKGNQKSGTTISDYTKVSYTTDGGTHHIFIVYRKDSSSHSGNDLGYVLIEK